MTPVRQARPPPQTQMPAASKRNQVQTPKSPLGGRTLHTRGVKSTGGAGTTGATVSDPTISINQQAPKTPKSTIALASGKTTTTQAPVATRQPRMSMTFGQTMTKPHPPKNGLNSATPAQPSKSPVNRRYQEPIKPPAEKPPGKPLHQ